MTEYYPIANFCKEDILDKAKEMNVVICDETLEIIITNLEDKSSRSESFMEQFWLEIEHNIRNELE